MFQQMHAKDHREHFHFGQTNRIKTDLHHITENEWFFVNRRAASYWAVPYLPLASGTGLLPSDTGNALLACVIQYVSLEKMKKFASIYDIDHPLKYFLQFSYFRFCNKI
ncbi:hypothetical protein CEXT_47191 [Caerostris extrusa]|uniref:Uncharacterized protein n=1 Tax=Caerostris extrusa TaxID=172846 RepID=A0AAV4Y8Y4_CAEEX|nr:hypothetical protein CEXT_47191 [Caerostris extrusa]